MNGMNTKWLNLAYTYVFHKISDGTVETSREISIFADVPSQLSMQNYMLCADYDLRLLMCVL